MSDIIRQQIFIKGSAMTRRQDEDEARRREAQRLLDRVAGEGEVIGTSTMARTAARAAERLGRHFSAADADRDGGDAAEVWGTRIGRALALAFVVLLIVWLAGTYL
ncbi:MAG TPA: hypothetical protein VMP03_08890 [Methylomirabilota bacterium]|nr:hypothetical protein [Methylomirabilota bacterium]